MKLLSLDARNKTARATSSRPRPLLMLWTALQPRSLEVFADLGVVDEVLAHRRTGMPMRITGANGTIHVQGGDPSEHRPDAPYTQSPITPQWRVGALQE